MTRLTDTVELAYHLTVIGMVFVMFALLAMGYWKYWWELAGDIIVLVFILSIAWLHSLGLLNWEDRQ